MTTSIDVDVVACRAPRCVVRRQRNAVFLRRLVGERAVDVAHGDELAARIPLPAGQVGHVRPPSGADHSDSYLCLGHASGLLASSCRRQRARCCVGDGEQLGVPRPAFGGCERAPVREAAPRVDVDEPRRSAVHDLAAALAAGHRDADALSAVDRGHPAAADRHRAGLPVRDPMPARDHRVPTWETELSPPQTQHLVRCVRHDDTRRPEPWPGPELRVGVIGAGRWAHMAHIPGWQRDPRCEVVAICDVDAQLAGAGREEFGIPLSDERRERAARARRHRRHRRRHRRRDALRAGDGGARGGQARAVREAGRVRLPRHAARRATWRATKGLKTKLGFTFRYSPAMRYMQELIDEGFVGTPFIFNGYEQNSQWLDPQTPLRQVDPDADQSVHPGVVARGLRRADHRHRPLVRGRRPDRGRRHDAQLHPRAHGARDRAR